MAQELLGPTLTMEHRPTDNLTICVEQVRSRVGRARDEAEVTAVLRRFLAEIREQINAERVAAASRLAGWLAHQINNPLGTISGNAQLLARRLERDIGDGDLLQAYLRYVEAIQSETERCARITSDLLDFTRPRDADLRSIDVRDAVTEALDLASYGRGQCKVSVAPTGEGDPPRAWADKELLVRVLYEVISNAIQAASDDGSVRIQVGMAPDEADGAEWVRITVADTGPGIAEDILPRVFEPFFSTREKARGLGLTTGLAIMRQLGGTIEVSETGPGGTVAAIQIPARKA